MPAVYRWLLVVGAVVLVGVVGVTAAVALMGAADPASGWWPCWKAGGCWTGPTPPPLLPWT